MIVKTSTPPPRFFRVLGVLLAVGLFLCAAFSFALVECGDGNEVTQPPPATRSTDLRSKNVNGIEWSISYYTDTNEIISISASYSENERTSTYYKKLAYRYGDNTAYVTHQYSFTGSPVGDNWYAIEQTEKAWNGWDKDEVFFERRTRYDEKIIF